MDIDIFEVKIMRYEANIIGFSAGSSVQHHFRDSFKKEHVRCFPEHVHNHLELIFITKGQFLMGYSDSEEYFDEGEVLIVNSMEPHWGKCIFRPHTENSYRYLLLDPNQLPQGLNGQLDRLIKEDFTFVNKVSAADAKASGLYECGLRLLKAIHETDVNSLERLGYAVLTLQAMMCHQSKKHGNLKQPKSPFTLKVEEYVEKHYTEALSTEQVAGFFGYEKSYFCRKFRRCFNQSFTDYLHKFRLKKFLSHPALNQQTIAYCAREVGYQSYSHFYQVFERIYKVSPRTYLMNRAVRLSGLEQSEKIW